MNDMHAAIDSREVAAALESACGTVKQVDDVSWESVLRNGSPFRIHARLENGWVCIRSPLDDRRAPHRLEYLWRLCTQDTPGLVRHAMRQDATVDLRADIPLNMLDRPALRAMIGCTCRNLALARHVATSGTSDSEGTAGSQHVIVPRAGDDGAGPRGIEAARDWMAGTTWPHRQSSASCVAVDMHGVGGLFHRVLVEDEGNGSLRLSAALDAVDRLPVACRSALALWILRVNAHTRLVRAAALDEEESTSVGLETILERPSAPLIEQSLRALFSACAVWGKGEVQALSDPHTAELFLTVADGPAALVHESPPQDGMGKEAKA